MFLYLFLVERAHQLVAIKLGRLQDPIYFLGMAIVLFGFGVLAVFAFLRPVTTLSSIDGKCRIGLPLVITIPLLTYDIVINFALTIVFIIRGARLTRLRNYKHWFKCVLMALPFRHVRGLRDPVIACEFFMGRSSLGAAAIILPTCANLVILFVLNGHENGWLCFTVCTIDSKFPIFCHFRRVFFPCICANGGTVTWSATIIHWLTSTKDDLGAGPEPNSTVAVRAEGQYVEM